jgi:hypothetical protein
VLYKRVVEWTVKDGQGRRHMWTIPDVYYNKTSPFRLLSPQHWVQAQSDNDPKPRSTWWATYEDCVELFWKQNSFMRTVPLSSSSNVALIRTAPSIQQFHSYCAAIGTDCPDSLDKQQFLLFPIMHSDDDDSIMKQGDLPERGHPDLPSDLTQGIKSVHQFQQKITD